MEQEVEDEKVAPHAGAWIETYKGVRYVTHYQVAPHAGAWIETVCPEPAPTLGSRRAPRGRVD